MSNKKHIDFTNKLVNKILETELLIKGDDPIWTAELMENECKLSGDPLPSNYELANTHKLFIFPLFEKIMSEIYSGAVSVRKLDPFIKISLDGVSHDLSLQQIMDEFGVNLNNVEEGSVYSNSWSLLEEREQAVIENLHNWFLQYLKDLFAEFKVFDVNVRAKVKDHIFNKEKSETYALLSEEAKSCEYISLKDVVYLLIKKYSN